MSGRVPVSPSVQAVGAAALAVLLTVGCGAATVGQQAGQEGRQQAGEVAGQGQVDAGAPAGAGPLATAPAPAATSTTSAPQRVRIPRLGVDSPLEGLSLDGNGVLAAPRDFAKAGWFTGGARPGDAGPAVIAGHVDSKAGPAVFYRLSELGAGDRVSVLREDGSQVDYVVTRLERFGKNAFPTQLVYGPTASPELRLITCTGYFDRTTRHYVDNLVVWAGLPGIRRF